MLEAPGNTALTVRPSGAPPPMPWINSRSENPIGSSYTPGYRTSPLSVSNIVPGESSVPIDRNHSAPSRRMYETFASVSGLFTTVGLGLSGRRKSPSIHGGTVRGRGGLPSITSRSAFSSPKRYSSGPVTSSTGTSPIRSAAAISRIACRTRSTSRAAPALMQIQAPSAPTARAAMASPSRTV